MADTRFPGPYVNSTKQDDSIMKYVGFDKTDIGARSSGQPKGDVLSSEMGIDHVSNRGTGATVKSKF